MKTVLASCLLLSLAGLSHQFPEQKCRSVPQQQCRNIEETVYESVTSKQCSQKPVEDCRQVQETTYEDVTRQECRDITEQSCKDVQDRQCKTDSKPVEVLSVNSFQDLAKIGCDT